MTAMALPATGGMLTVLLLAGCVGHAIAPTTKETGTNTNPVAKVTASGTNQEPLRVVVSFPAEIHPAPISGRVLLFMCHSAMDAARWSMFWDPQPVFGIEVTNLSPEVEVVFELRKFWSPKALCFGYGEMLPGTYYAQALVDLDHLHAGYHNAGNLYSPMAKCYVAAGFKGDTLKLVMNKAMDEEPPVKDTDRVKRVEMRSKLLSDFLGREVMLRAGVIVPSTFSEKPNAQYPALYEIPSSSGDYREAWWRFAPEQEPNTDHARLAMLRVFVDPQGPFGHTHLANSVNNGPVGDALVQELIPEIERRFRAIPHGYARFLAGHSAGGWASLWLQVNYPDSFGGCWSMSPDPVDFSAFQTINIYEDKNGHWTREGFARPLGRVGNKVVLTFPQIDQWDYVVGAGFPLGSFNAVFSPRGANGEPRPLINRLTGRIDSQVADHWRRYDILSLLKKEWPTLAPKLRGKLHVVGGSSDTYYLDAALDNLQAFLETTDYGGYVEIHPGDHSSYRGPELMDRFNQEMAEQFAAGLKASPHPAATAEAPSP